MLITSRGREDWLDPATCPDYPDRCQRVFEVDVRVSLFGICAMAEKMILADISKDHDKAAEITNRYIRDHLRGTP